MDGRRPVRQRLAQWTAPRVVNGVLLMALLAGSAVVWPNLPDLIPIHFDLAGEPDRWVDSSLLAWFGMPLLAVGLTLVMEWFGQLGLVYPEFLNVPEKEEFLRLPEERRHPIMLGLRDLLGWIAVVTTAMLMLIQRVIYLGAYGQTAGMALGTALALGAIGVPIVAFLNGYRLSVRIRAAVRDAARTTTQGEAK